MTDFIAPGAAGARPKASILVEDANMKRRNAAETRFRLYGLAAIAISLATLFFMLWTIFSDGVSAFWQAKLTMPVTLSSEVLDPAGNGNREDMLKVTTVGYTKLLAQAFQAELAAKGVDLGGLKPKEVAALISKDAAGDLRAKMLANPGLLDTTITADLLAAGRVDGYLKGRVTMLTAERDNQISPEQLQLADRLIAAGLLSSQWNWDFFTNPDASDQRPEAAGLGVAILGSLYLMLLVAVICVPVGVAAARLEILTSIRSVQRFFGANSSR